MRFDLETGGLTSIEVPMRQVTVFWLNFIFPKARLEEHWKRGLHSLVSSYSSWVEIQGRESRVDLAHIAFLP